MDKVTSLKGIQRVRFNNFTEYEFGKSGAYGFWTDYTRLENGMWEISYGTTADLDFCPVCGVKQGYCVVQSGIVVMH